MKKKFLTKQEIELANSYGPFNHSHWDGGGVSISNEEGLRGRADFLVQKIRETIVKNFTTAQLKKLTILDVGCYDGWILHQLSDLPFQKMVGIEPRAKNLTKGENIRKLLGIKTRVGFKIGSLEKLGKEKFDIVLCVGVLHHVSSIVGAMEQLDSICNKLLIVDTVCFPSSYITDSFKKDIEMKDVIYQFQDKMCGITAQKYESSYYDGSTTETTVISIPSKETLLMHLKIMGYDPICVVATPSDFMKAMKENKRPFHEIMISGIRKLKKSDYDLVREYAEVYEGGLLRSMMPQKIIGPLYQHYVAENPVSRSTRTLKKFMHYLDFAEGDPASFFKYSNKYEMEIVRNMRFNPREKISLEWAKILYSKKLYQEAIGVLEGITQKLNSDWRCTYRSFYLLAEIYFEIGKLKKSRYYAKLCKECHANFPLIRGHKLV